MKQRFFFFTILLLILSLPIKGVPAFPHPIVITQPDGSTLTVQRHGDEHRKITTTADGYIIKKNQHGIYTYAIADGFNRFIPGETVARDPEKRDADDLIFLSKVKKITEIEDESVSSPSKINRVPSATTVSTGFPRTGTPKSLVIMVNFSDLSFVVPNSKDAFTRLLNQEDYSDNGGTGSAKDYFEAASNGLFSPQFDVVGPYTLPNPMAFYGANDPETLDDVKPAYMIVHACDAANKAGLDFTQYDADNDGYIDNVFVYYAGYNEAELGPDNSIWPHRWVVFRNFNYVGTSQSVVFDGKTVYDYACTSELKGNSGTTMCGIGTFTHEFGHVIGMPDYYHTSANKNSLNYWNIMDAGAYLNAGRTPPTYSAYDRFYLGWQMPEEISTAADKVLFPISQSEIPSGSTAKQAYLLSATTHNLIGDNPLPNEFYIMEYRKKTGWDTYLPSEGLLFWHIDYNQTAWENNEVNNYTDSLQTAASHMRVYLQPLSGYIETPGTAFTTGSFDPLTWSGIRIDRAITDISKTSDSISFKILGGSPTEPVATPRITAGVISETLQFPAILSGTATTKYLNIKTTDLSGDLTISIGGTSAALFTTSVQSISMSAANSESGANINITYRPVMAGTHTALLTIAGGGLVPDKVIELKGSTSD
jgi:M6 family metalloprotease-like protein